MSYDTNPPTRSAISADCPVKSDHNIFPRALQVLLTIVLLGLAVGCQTDGEPDLPAETDTMAIAEQVTGPNGEAFLREITAQSWNDDGRRAAALFAWIPQDAHSPNADIATRAGQTAQAIASFIADSNEAATDAPANHLLWQSYSEGLIPYLGAMVGDRRNVSGFTPLDGLDTEMPRTAALFATVIKKPVGQSGVTKAASARAHSYESEFAEAAVAEPLAADRGEVQEGLLQAARLRGLIAAGTHLAKPEVPRRATIADRQ